MGLISKIAAPAVLPPRVGGTAVPPASTAALGVGQIVTDLHRIWPVTPPANSETIVRDHLTDPDFTRPLEAEGLKLDGIPFIGDEAILLDDLPQDSPTPTGRPASRQATADTLPPKADSPPAPDHGRSAAAARAYEDARAISGLHPFPQAQPIAEAEPAQSPENRAPA